LATGEAGSVYVCHPFLVHAAQMHRGSVPRFMAQPPLHPAEPFRLDRVDGDYSPVEMASDKPCGNAQAKTRRSSTSPLPCEGQVGSLQ
jgi:hypothetical protein